jgi:acetyl-CoA carboxylase biotin carboxylase subunit
VECLYQNGEFYFLEMNTRIQVEHPVTELVTGVDLVQWQIRIARGERLTLDPEAMLRPRAHAIECRIYAEDPDNGFLPSPGTILKLRAPQGPGVRDDSGATEGLAAPIFYDPMISKLITWGDDRPQALARMRRALREYEVHGIKTTIPFFTWALDDPDFLAGRFDTSFIDRKLAERAGAPFDVPTPEDETLAAIAAALHLAERAPAAAAVAPVATAPSRWRQQARAEAVR